MANDRWVYNLDDDADNKFDPSLFERLAEFDVRYAMDTIVSMALPYMGWEFNTSLEESRKIRKPYQTALFELIAQPEFWDVQEPQWYADLFEALRFGIREFSIGAEDEDELVAIKIINELIKSKMKYDAQHKQVSVSNITVPDNVTREEVEIMVGQVQKSLLEVLAS